MGKLPAQIAHEITATLCSEMVSSYRELTGHMSKMVSWLILKLNFASNTKFLEDGFEEYLTRQLQEDGKARGRSQVNSLPCVKSKPPGLRMFLWDYDPDPDKENRRNFCSVLKVGSRARRPLANRSFPVVSAEELTPVFQPWPTAELASPQRIPNSSPRGVLLHSPASHPHCTLPKSIEEAKNGAERKRIKEKDSEGRSAYRQDCDLNVTGALEAPVQTSPLRN